jgi:hypothetical protein
MGKEGTRTWRRRRAAGERVEDGKLVDDCFMVDVERRLVDADDGLIVDVESFLVNVE